MLQEKNNRLVVFWGLVFWAIFLWATLFPNHWWAIHYNAFLPAGAKWGVMAIAAFFITTPLWWKKEQLKFPVKGSALFFGVLALLAGALFYGFPIVKDVYGDAIFVAQDIDVNITQWDSRLLSELLAFNPLETKTGLLTTFAMVNMGHYLSGASGKEVLQMIDAVMGCWFVWLWLRLVHRTLSNNWARLVGWIMGLLAPFMLLFFGHLETYSLIVVGLLGYFAVLLRYFDTRKGKYLWYMLFWWLLCMKFHITSYLLLPSLLMTVLYHYQSQQPKVMAWLRWKRLLLWVAIPGTLLVLVYYFLGTDYAFKDRQFNGSNFEEYLLMPFQTSDPEPFNRYNLLSPMHLFDYLMLFFTWSVVGLMLLLNAISWRRKDINWNRPVMVVVGITTLAYVGAFFILNPILGLTIDWDLFSLPGIPFLVLLLLLLREMKTGLRAMAMTSLGVGILCLATFVVNTNKHTLSVRLMTLGIHSYSAHYMGASSEILAGAELEPDVVKRMAQLEGVIQELTPMAVPGRDVEYAALLCELGIWQQQHDGHFNRAIDNFKQAYTFAPDLRKNVYQLVIANFMLQRYNDAHQHVELLTKMKYPDAQKAMRVAIHVSIEANELDDAKRYCQQYLQQWPGSSFIQKVLEALQRNASHSELRALFAST